MHDQLQIASEAKRIRDANSAYRRGTPIMDDREYDDLVDSFRDAIGETAFSEFRTTLAEDPGKVRHPYAMGSLEKIKAFDGTCPIKGWIERNVANNGDGSEGLFVSSKIDGCSARVTYSDGRLIGCSTRGDGRYGVDILDKAVSFMPTELQSKFTGDIRGEITLTHDTLEDLKEFTGEDYKNIRNATAGLINSKQSSDDGKAAFLRFFPYEIMGCFGMTKREQFAKLRRLGFTTALHAELTDIYDSRIASYDDAMLAIYNRFSEEAPYDIDGLVVTDLNDTLAFEDEFIPKRTVAVKFNQMTATTRLIGIEWNVSKNGDLRPVGIVEPVCLGGAQVSAVTLNNIRFIKEHGLRYGCAVTVLKSGDIIPKIVGESHPDPSSEAEIEYPSECPSCGSALKYTFECLYPHCPNTGCDGIVHGKVLHFLKQLGIKHLSLKTIAKFGLNGVRDIMAIEDDGGAVKRRFIKDVYDRMFGADRETLLSAFDYDGVSSLIIGKMLAHYGYDRLLVSCAEELKADMPHGVGEKFIDKFVCGYAAVKDDYQSILSDPRYHGESKPLSKKETVSDGVLGGKGFAVTGSLGSMSRKQFEATIRMNGGRFCSSVTKATDYLVTNETAMTSKRKKASELGVKVIDESGFLGLVKKGDEVSIF